MIRYIGLSKCTCLTTAFVSPAVFKSYDLPDVGSGGAMSNDIPGPSTFMDLAICTTRGGLNTSLTVTFRTLVSNVATRLIMLSPWPAPDAEPGDEDALEEAGWETGAPETPLPEVRRKFRAEVSFGLF